MKNRSSAAAARLYLAQQYLADASTPDSIAQCQVFVILYHNRERARLVGEDDGYGEETPGKK